MRNLKLFTYFSLLSLILLFSSNLASQTIYTISNPEALEDQTYVAGDVIILANGVYDSDERIDFIGNGTADNPITFRAESPGGVIFTGGLQLNIGGDYVVVDGFHWKGGYGASNFIQFRNGSDYANHSTIQNCAIDGLTVDPDDLEVGSSIKHRWIVLYGTYNTVINCSFMNKSNAGAIVLVELQYNAENDPCALVGHTISNNYFYKYAKIDTSLSNSGDSETIRLGASGYQNVNSSTTVSNNYFVESDGENEIITNKSKNNSFINNTFRRCRGSLVLRHGSHATVNGNYFLGEDIEGTGGVRISDSYHSITNNYIQDCINVNSQAQWNNGITFIGGNDNAAVDCTATSGITNGYQKVENIDISNNTIINTNAPLYYNIAKGSTDPTGTVDNNLIYFSAGDPSLTNAITGDYSSLGTSLSYTGNVYTGTVLGVTNSGFSEETGITATAKDEVFTFSGTGTDGKGADMDTYEPTTDDMVGYGIGACFLNNLGTNITNGICTIVVGEYITVSSLSTLSSIAGNYDVSVNANVSWTAVSNDDWISIDTNSGASGNVAVSLSVTKNEVVSSRTGTVTFTQDAGGDDIVRILNITQEGVELTDLYSLINTGTGLDTDKVTVHFFSKEEVNGSTKFNYAKNTLDKDNSTVWAADDGAILSGDYKGDGEYIIYDLGDIYDLDLIQFSTTNKSDSFGFQVLVSTTGTEIADFSMVLPTSGELLLTSTNTTGFNQHEVSSTARYIKLLGFGRFNSDGDTRVSAWSAVGEIEFYGKISGQTGTDSDGDGVLDDNDNCPNTSNPDQADFDADGTGDVCDNDIDGDSVFNDDDTCPNTPSTEAANANGCSVSQTGGLIPSDLMNNCNQWKITYPDGEEDKTLCGEPNNEFFYVNDAQDAIVFYAPIRSDNGTTPNSSYIRSELRERVQDGSADIYWNTEGSHMIYVKQAITHLPMNKPHLVATQIHGNKDDGIDDAMVLRLEDSHLFLSFNGGKLREDVTIKTNYTLGTKHEVIFHVINGKHYCYYAEDGNLLDAYNSGDASSYLIKADGNDYVMDLNYDETYFKVGNYTQSNVDEEGSDTDDPNNYGEVLVYNFLVEHDEVSVTGVSLSPSSIDLLLGSTVQLSASIKPLTASNNGVSYSSSNSSIASVDPSSGLVTAKSEGIATITATTDEGGFTAESIINVVAPYNGENLALNKPITESGTHDADNIPENLVDGSLDTKWSVSGFPQTAIIDLGAVYSLERTEMVCHNDRDYQFTIATSLTENGSYEEIVDRSANTTPGSKAYPIINSIEGVEGRYVKINVTGAATYTGSWMSLVEFRIFGKSSSSNDMDTDGDGILNAQDKCPSTALGSIVDANGCTLLSSDNFSIEVISETCPNKDNGQLRISANENLNYKLTLNGEVYNFTTDINFENLSPGIYEICIEVEDYSSPYCYSVEVIKGTTISGKSSIKNKQLQVEVSNGTLPYGVFVNGDLKFETYQTDFKVDVNHGDLIEVKTAFECEGVFAKEIQLFEVVEIYPNPSKGLFTIALPISAKQGYVKVFNNLSQLIIADFYDVQNRRIQLNLTGKQSGIYLVSLYLDKEYLFKIIKK